MTLDDPYDNIITLEEKENAIADLCIAAERKHLPSVRDCLRKYDASVDMRVIENEMKSCTKGQIVETLEFLGCHGMADYYKDHCDTRLICRIQNFMPDKCGVCDEKFCIKLDEEKPLMECVMCGQGCHNPCVLNSLGKTADDLNSMSQEEIDKMINPCKDLGMIYMCHACQKIELPSSTDGLTEDGAKKRQVAHSKPKQQKAVRKTHETPNTSRSIQFESGTAENPVIVADAVLGSADYPIAVEDDNGLHNIPKKTSESVCRYYKRGSCKHGASGKKDGTCPYAHPKYCRNYVMYGNKSPRGCKKGDQCNQFHPKMCPRSLTDGVCYNTTCKHRHLKNTKREMPINIADSTLIHGNRNSSTNTSQDTRTALNAQTQGHVQTMSKQHIPRQSDPFLDALKQFKEEMIATIDLKLKEMLKSDQYPPLPLRPPMQPYQAQYQFNPPHNPHNQFRHETRSPPHLTHPVHPIQYQ